MRAATSVIVTMFCLSITLGEAFAGTPAKGQVIEKAQFLAPEPTPVSNSSMSQMFSEPEVVSEGGCSTCASGCGTGCDDGCGSDCGACCDRCGCSSCCCGCNMYQHHPYFPPMHGYYYFRPYHHSHVRQQRMMVQSWGGNPAHPYANEIFQAVYEQYKAEGRARVIPGSN